jgi:hypothetical protein
MLKYSCEKKSGLSGIPVESMLTADEKKISSKNPI